jgi:hypothetical protein
MCPQLPLFARRPKRTLRPLALALGLAPALAVGLAGCAQPGELLAPGAIAGVRAPSPWQVQLNLPPPDYSRRLSDGEGEFVVAGAIAAHEMRRP